MQRKIGKNYINTSIHLFPGQLLEVRLERKVSGRGLEGQLSIQLGQLATLVAQVQGHTDSLLLGNAEVHARLQCAWVMEMVALDLEVDVLISNEKVIDFNIT